MHERFPASLFPSLPLSRLECLSAVVVPDEYNYIYMYIYIYIYLEVYTGMNAVQE